MSEREQTVEAITRWWRSRVGVEDSMEKHIESLADALETSQMLVAARALWRTADDIERRAIEGVFRSEGDRRVMRDEARRVRLQGNEIMLRRITACAPVSTKTEKDLVVEILDSHHRVLDGGGLPTCNAGDTPGGWPAGDRREHVADVLLQYLTLRVKEDG